jgi:hypothetical protein
VPLGLLFGVLTLALAGVAAASAAAGEWVIAVCAAVLAGWLATLSASALRKRRR